MDQRLFTKRTAACQNIASTSILRKCEITQYLLFFEKFIERIRKGIYFSNLSKNENLQIVKILRNEILNALLLWRHFISFSTFF